MNCPNELAAKAAAKAAAVAEKEAGRGGTDWRRKSEFLFHISGGRCKITDARDGWTDDGFTGSAPLQHHLKVQCRNTVASFAV